jgi:hypothetical protein
MRRLFVPVVAALLVLCAVACGGTRSASQLSSDTAASSAVGGTAPVAALPQIELKGDADLDSDKYGTEPDNESEVFGHPASAADARAVTMLVKRYFAAAAHDDGAVACRLIYSPLAESLPEDAGEADAPASLRGIKTCAVIVSKLLEPLHKRLSANSATLKVVAVRIDLNRGSVRLGLNGRRRDQYIAVHRERGIWKIDALLDVGRPVGVE